MTKKRKRKKEEKKAAIGFWKRNYSEVWNYLKESKGYIWGIFAVFLIISVLGYFFPVFFVEEIQEIVRGLLAKIEGLNTWQLILFILRNNVLSSLFSLLLGIVFGIVPLFSAILNGYILGFVSNVVTVEAGFGQLWRLLPHGIFEIPAIIISMGLGIKFGMFLFSKKPTAEFQKRLLMNLKVFLFVILPLLIVAAIIEGVLMIALG